MGSVHCLTLLEDKLGWACMTLCKKAVVAPIRTTQDSNLFKASLQSSVSTSIMAHFHFWGTMSVVMISEECDESVKGQAPFITSELQQTKVVALSPQANYTDWSTATCRRNLMPTSVDRGVSRGQRGGSTTIVNLSFLDRSRYFSFK
jgi:hypothetical protein